MISARHKILSLSYCFGFLILLCIADCILVSGFHHGYLPPQQGGQWRGILTPQTISFTVSVNVLGERAKRRPLRCQTVCQAGSNTSVSVESLKRQICSKAISVRRGLAANPAQVVEIEKLLTKLEMQCPISAPARDVRMEGEWQVEYTTAPSPSNGKLGVFEGEARQVINLSKGTYVNLLLVPPNDWLVAELAATWEEWNGEFLDEGNDADDERKDGLNTAEKVSSSDYGASCWKVAFKTLRVKCLGWLIFEKEFVETYRVWRMTYLDDDTRIVRAGRTGKPEEDFVFYMTRKIVIP